MAAGAFSQSCGRPPDARLMPKLHAAQLPQDTAKHPRPSTAPFNRNGPRPIRAPQWGQYLCLSEHRRSQAGHHR